MWIILNVKVYGMNIEPMNVGTDLCVVCRKNVLEECLLSVNVLFFVSSCICDGFIMSLFLCLM